VIRLKVFQTML